MCRKQRRSRIRTGTIVVALLQTIYLLVYLAVTFTDTIITECPTTNGRGSTVLWNGAETRERHILIMGPRCLASVSRFGLRDSLCCIASAAVAERDVSNAHWQSIDDNNATVPGGQLREGTWPAMVNENLSQTLSINWPRRASERSGDMLETNGDQRWIAGDK